MCMHVYMADSPIRKKRYCWGERLKGISVAENGKAQVNYKYLKMHCT